MNPKAGRASKAGRLGPRPLPLHLMNALTSWLSSAAALPSLKNGWPRSKPELASAAQDLAAQLAAVAPEAFSAALDRELRSQADVVPARHRAVSPPCLSPRRWRCRDRLAGGHDAAARLCASQGRYGGGTPVLVVPSLINRFYILDLNAERSLLRYLAAEGLRPLVVDWDKPGAVERSFRLTDYIAGRLEAALEAAITLTGQRATVVGYCMGGLLALALAQRRMRDVAALVLLATPWDFHAEQIEQARLLGSLAEPLAAGCHLLGEIPVDVLQSFFAALDPMLALRKFSRFAGARAGRRRGAGFRRARGLAQ